jgi:hypothetical protein
MMHRTNSLAQSSFFPNDPHAMQSAYQYPGPGASPGQQRLNTALSPRSMSRSNMLSTLSDGEAMQMALLLSQQEAEFGVNMYDALRPQDEADLQGLIASGYTNEQAVLCLFERRFVPRNAAPPLAPVPQQRLPSRDSSWDRPEMQQPYYAPGPAPGAMYPSPAGVPRPGLPRQASMMPTQPPPTRMQSTYNMAPPPAADVAPVVVTAIPLALDDLNEVQAHAAPARAVGVAAGPPGPLTRSGGSAEGSAVRGGAGSARTSAAPTSSPAPAPAPQRGLNRQASTMSSASAASAAGAAASSPAPGGRPQLTKKRSIFNFTSVKPSDEIAPKEKLKYKEADVKTLTNMGYSREQAVWALLQNNNNVPMAIDALCRS